MNFTVKFFTNRTANENEFVGSGFGIAQGWVLTCQHVLEGCGESVWMKPSDHDAAEEITGRTFQVSFDDGNRVLDLALVPCTSKLPATAKLGIRLDRSFWIHDLNKSKCRVIGGIHGDRRQILNVTQLTDMNHGMPTEVQVMGGVVEGYSGSPLVIDSNGEAIAIGVAYHGSHGANHSRLFLLDPVVDFIRKGAVEGLSDSGLAVVDMSRRAQNYVVEMKTSRSGEPAREVSDHDARNAVGGSSKGEGTSMNRSLSDDDRKFLDRFFGEKDLPRSSRTPWLNAIGIDQLPTGWGFVEDPITHKEFAIQLHLRMIRENRIDSLKEHIQKLMEEFGHDAPSVEKLGRILTKLGGGETPNPVEPDPFQQVFRVIPDLLSDALRKWFPERRDLIAYWNSIGGDPIPAQLSSDQVYLHVCQRSIDSRNAKLLKVIAREIWSQEQVDSISGLEQVVRQKVGMFDFGTWNRESAAHSARVCQVQLIQDDQGLGTGFLVGPDVVLTNYHVLEKVIKGNIDAESVRFRFDFRTVDGDKADEGKLVKLADPGSDSWLIAKSPVNEVDYALVRLAEAIGDEILPYHMPRGWIEIPANQPPIDDIPVVIILQHPQLDFSTGKQAPIQLAIETDPEVRLIHNGNRIRYMTNTSSGSSGSPVFDGNWTLVALHQAGNPEYNSGIPIGKIRSDLERLGLAGVLGKKPDRSTARTDANASSTGASAKPAKAESQGMESPGKSKMSNTAIRLELSDADWDIIKAIMAKIGFGAGNSPTRRAFVESVVGLEASEQSLFAELIAYPGEFEFRDLFVRRFIHLDEPSLNVRLLKELLSRSRKEDHKVWLGGKLEH